jgi:hypothetical protein
MLYSIVTEFRRPKNKLHELRFLFETIIDMVSISVYLVHF